MPTTESKMSNYDPRSFSREADRRQEEFALMHFQLNPFNNAPSSKLDEIKNLSYMGQSSP